MKSVATFHDVLSTFPRERQWLLPALQALQHAYGYLSREALATAADHLRVPSSEVHGVATHYPELRLTERGQHHVRVCRGVTCALLGGRELMDAVTARYRDANVTVEPADCFFECSVAPLIEVDGAYHGRVGLGDVARLEQWFSPASGSGTGVGHNVASGASSSSRAAVPPVSGRQPQQARSAEATLDALVANAKERRATRPTLRVFVQMGTCGRAVGAEALSSALRQRLDARGFAAEIVEGACNGMCYAAPLVEVERLGWPRVLIERLSPESVDALVDTLSNDDADFAAAGLAGLVWSDERWRGLAPVALHPFWKDQERVLLRRAGTIDPGNLGDAVLAGAYRALAPALGGSPARVIDEVKASGLQGRGGAFFPTAVKWDACRRATGEPKYLVMNGEEGEPGIFKDRHLMEADPHQVLEGVLLAAYASGATRAILYVHGEANLSAARLAEAVAHAEAAGIVGDRILGSDVACRVEIRRGAGGFVLGEETALLESIEGKRAQPRTRPPFPVESGLWGRPTVINNVETLSAIPSIVGSGAARFAALGTAKAPGTKVFGLSGPIHRPGVVEVRNGVTLRTLLERIGGGLVDGRQFLGALVGGPSGTIVPASLFDTPMEPREQVSPGTGGIVALPEGASVIDVVKTLLAFNAEESCGKCTPCREGAPRLLAMVDELLASSDRDATLQRLRDLADTIQLASLCGLGQAAPLALLRALNDFRSEFAPRIHTARP